MAMHASITVSFWDMMVSKLGDGVLAASGSCLVWVQDFRRWFGKSCLMRARASIMHGLQADDFKGSVFEPSSTRGSDACSLWIMCCCGGVVGCSMNLVVSCTPVKS